MNGIAADEINDWNIGFIIDYIYQCHREKLKRSGKRVVDTEERYEKMKQLEPLIDERYKNGEVEQERYDSFKRMIREYEVSE